LPTGAHNAITDVAGVLVGQTTLISGDGPLVVGQGPVRTGVTVILPSRTIGEAEAGGDAVFSLRRLAGSALAPWRVVRLARRPGEQPAMCLTHGAGIRRMLWPWKATRLQTRLRAEFP
jgi:hypothetical protein